MIRSKTLALALVLLGSFAVVLQLGPASFASQADKPSAGYHATILDDPANGTIDVRLRPKSRRIAVSVRNAVVQCDDHTTFPVNFTGLQGKATEAGRFQVQRYYHGMTGQIYLEIAGTLRRNRAQGAFYYLRNSVDGFAPDCSTGVPVPWSGERR